MVASFLWRYSVFAQGSTRDARIAKLAGQFSIHHDEIATILVSTIDKPEKNWNQCLLNVSMHTIIYGSTPRRSIPGCPTIWMFFAATMSMTTCQR